MLRLNPAPSIDPHQGVALRGTPSATASNRTNPKSGFDPIRSEGGCWVRLQKVCHVAPEGERTPLCHDTKATRAVVTDCPDMRGDATSGVSHTTRHTRGSGKRAERCAERTACRTYLSGV